MNLRQNRHERIAAEPAVDITASHLRLEELSEAAQQRAPLRRIDRGGHWAAPAVREPRRACLGVKRPREEEPLRLLASDARQQRCLLRGLHPFGDDAHLSAARQRNDHSHNRRAVGVGRDIANEGPVDLQGVEREALQVAQAGVAGAEVIHREKKSALLECAERLNRPSGIAHQAALGDARVRSSTAGRPRRAMAAKRSARLTCANCRGETLTATRPIGSPASEASWTCRAPFPAPTRRPARCSRFHRAAE